MSEAETAVSIPEVASCAGYLNVPSLEGYLERVSELRLGTKWVHQIYIRRISRFKSRLDKSSWHSEQGRAAIKYLAFRTSHPNSVLPKTDGQRLPNYGINHGVECGGSRGDGKPAHVTRLDTRTPAT